MLVEQVASQFYKIGLSGTLGSTQIGAAGQQQSDCRRLADPLIAQGGIDPL
jgi:hypothetical protein